jgi:hypothetical protein
MKPIKTIVSDTDSQNRQFIWTAYEDGTAMSREITFHLDAFFLARETWRKEHPAGSDEAAMIHAMEVA